VDLFVSGTNKLSSCVQSGIDCWNIDFVDCQREIEPISCQASSVAVSMAAEEHFSSFFWLSAKG
jgi:hypothetical protein